MFRKVDISFILLWHGCMLQTCMLSFFDRLAYMLPHSKASYMYIHRFIYGAINWQYDSTDHEKRACSGHSLQYTCLLSVLSICSYLEVQIASVHVEQIFIT